MSWAWRAAASLPVSTTSRAGSTRSIRWRSSRGDTSGAALTEMPSSSPGLSVMRWASGSVSCAVPDPPPEVLPSRWRPTIRYAFTPAWPAMRSVSPMSNPSRSAVDSSIEASSEVRGGRPSV